MPIKKIKKTAKLNEFWLRNKDSMFKYRVWGRNEKKFVEGECEITIEKGNILFKKNGVFLNEKDYVIQQFVGRNDINGKEIYEGDILKTDELGWEGVVVFGHGFFAIEDGKGGFSSMPMWKNCEVIGNIYENPEKL